jgi:tetratricopeptide (TPR) repeat protein
MSNLATSYETAGKLDLALPLLEEAFKRHTAVFGPNHPETLRTMGNLGAGYKVAGKLDRALPLLEDALKRETAVLGPTHPHTLTTQYNLAMCYQAAGKLDRALPLFEGALERQTAVLGPDHPHTLATQYSLAGAYLFTRKPDKALPLFEDTLKRRTAVLGATHPQTFQTTNALAACYWRLQRLDRSVPLFEELLPRQEKKLGRTHPSTLMTVANLGVNYKDAGRLAEAIPLLEEAHRASKRHPDLAWVVSPLLEAYLQARKVPEAAKLIDAGLATARKTLPETHPQLAGLLAQYGFGLLEAGGFTQAEPLLRECLAIREKVQPGAWNTFNTMSLLGGALLGQKKYAEAEPLLVKGYEGMKAREKTIPRMGGGELRIPEALDRLIELYTVTDKPDEVAKWRAQRKQYPFLAPPPRAKD